MDQAEIERKVNSFRLSIQWKYLTVLRNMARDRGMKPSGRTSQSFRDALVEDERQRLMQETTDENK